MQTEQEEDLILASGSPRRRELLDGAGYRFRVFPADVEEIHDPALSVEELVRHNAVLKARAVAGRFPRSIVIGSDTLVALDRLALGKPETLEEAFHMISRLSGRTHVVLTGVCLLRAGDARERVFVEETRVTFRELNEPEIRHYLSLINPLDKAGSYAAQEHGDLILQGIEGSWSNVVGLPMESLARALETFAK
jgi:septum formation protein